MRLNTVAYVERKSIWKKNIVISIIYILILSLLTVGVISFFSAWKIIHPTKITTPQITANIATDYKNVSFLCTESKEKLYGWYFNKAGSANTVLLVHGYGKNRLQFDEETFKLINRFVNDGFNVLTFDLRGSGNSAGSKTTFGMNETTDVLSAITYLKRQQGTQKIVLMGFSTGASACLNALTQTKYRDSIAGVIADSPYSKVENYISDLVDKETWLPNFPFNSSIGFVTNLLSKADQEELNLIRKIHSIIPTPVYFIDGAQENFNPYDNTKMLYELYFRKRPTSVNYWNSGCTEYGQSFMQNQNEYIESVSNFAGKVVVEKTKK